MNLQPRWFRFHLGTAIVMMIAASVILGLNVKHDYVVDWKGRPIYGYGWPLPCYTTAYDRETYEWLFGKLAFDALTACLLLGVIAVVLEKRVAIQKKRGNRQ